MPRPADVPRSRWQVFIDDVGRFLNRWAAHANALGWQSLDLFGCDSTRPFSRVDRAGLLWFVNGGGLVALTETTATIETATGARKTYRRRADHAPGRVLAWELVP